MSRERLLSTLDKLEHVTENLSRSGLKCIAGMQNLSLNELEQITEMNNLSKNKLQKYVEGKFINCSFKI